MIAEEQGLFPKSFKQTLGQLLFFHRESPTRLVLGVTGRSVC